jgi:hypothetical protein
MPMPSSLPPEPREITSIIRPANVQCVIAALDPAFSIDYAGMAAVLSYAFDREMLLVGHVHRVPGAGASSLDLVREFMAFIAAIKQKSGAQWAASYSCLDATKDRSVVDRMFELGLGGRRATGRGAVNFAPLTGILFGGAGAQATLGQPLFANLPGRGRYSAPCWTVPKVEMYVRLREKLALGLLKLAPGESTQQLLRELESLEARITAARRVSIQPGGSEDHDDLADALAMAVWLAHQYDAERSRAMRSAMGPRRPAPSSRAWT